MTNSADPDQLASSEANWSGSTLFAKAGYIRVQKDKGWFSASKTLVGDPKKKTLKRQSQLQQTTMMIHMKC